GRVARRHALLARKLLAWELLARWGTEAGGAREPRLCRARRVREGRAVGARVGMVEPRLAVSRGRVAGRVVARAARGSGGRGRGAGSGKRGSLGERTLFGETAGRGERPRSRRRLGRVAARPGEPARGGSLTGRRARAGEGARLLEAVRRGPGALARER